MAFVTVQKGCSLSHSIEDYPDGIVIPVDKPYRWTSADVIRKVKWMAVKHFGKRNLKVGHAGTLDPLATGVLLVCIGKATKFAEEFQKAPKQYLAGVTFGATTASYDLEKEIDKTYSTDGVSRESLLSVLSGFIGEQDQVAPLFSAKSVDGVRVYEMARKLYKQGKAVDNLDILHASRITIYGMELVEYRNHRIAEGGTPLGGCPILEAEKASKASSRIHVADISGYDLPQAEILVDCSKGTYIRALARDLGEALDSGAFLHSLRRTRNGGFKVEDALGIDDIEAILQKL